VFADPSVRIKQLVDSFGSRGVFASICTAEFGTVLQQIAAVFSAPFGADASR
jgi:hypothetical protein